MKMFWGLILEPGKKYEQKTEASFHLTMAALEPSSKTPTPNKPSFTSVIAESNKTPFILCNLDQDKVAQQPLDLVFTEGEPISFSVNGQNKVHLTGYIMPDSDMEDSEDMYDLDGSEDDSEAEEMLAALANDKKRKQAPDAKDANKKVKFGGDEVQAAPGKAEKKQEKAKQQPAKAGKNDVAAKPNQKPKLPVGLGEDEDDEDDDEDDDMDSEDMNDLLDQFDDDEDDDDEEDDEDEDESSPEAKKPSKPQGKPQIQKGTPAKGGQQPKQEKNQNQNNQQGTPQQKKPFQGGNKNQPWSGNKNKGQNNNFNKNQNSGKKGTPQNNQKFGGSPGNKNKKPWQNKK